MHGHSEDWPAENFEVMLRKDWGGTGYTGESDFSFVCRHIRPGRG